MGGLENMVVSGEEKEEKKKTSLKEIAKAIETVMTADSLLIEEKGIRISFDLANGSDCPFEVTDPAGGGIYFNLDELKVLKGLLNKLLKGQ